MSDLKLITGNEINEREAMKKKRHDLFETLKHKSNEIALILKNQAELEGKEYTLDDYLAFSFITLMNAAVMVEQFKKPTMYLLNFWIDGQIALEEEKVNNSHGILSLETK